MAYVLSNGNETDRDPNTLECNISKTAGFRDSAPKDHRRKWHMDILATIHNTFHTDDRRMQHCTNSAIVVRSAKKALKTKKSLKPSFLQPRVMVKKCVLEQNYY